MPSEAGFNKRSITLKKREEEDSQWKVVGFFVGPLIGGEKKPLSGKRRSSAVVPPRNSPNGDNGYSLMPLPGWLL